MMRTVTIPPMFATAPTSFRDTILGLKRCYETRPSFLGGSTPPVPIPLDAVVKFGPTYEQHPINVQGGDTVFNQTFIGSAEALFLSSRVSMVHEAPACLAAPLVTLIAREKMQLGSDSGRMTLYAPLELMIATRELTMRNVKFMELPENGTIACKKLIWQGSQEQNPTVTLEVIQSWFLDEDVEILTDQL